MMQCIQVPPDCGSQEKLTPLPPFPALWTTLLPSLPRADSRLGNPG